MIDRTPIFDAVRIMLGRGFTGPEIQALDNAINVFLGEEPATGIGPAGIDLIKQFEGCHKILPDGRIAAYPDPATGGEPWTIGTGATRYEDGSRVRKGDIITQERADDILRHDLGKFTAGVLTALGGVQTTQNQLDAMISLAFNVGISAFSGSTLLRLHKAGNYTDAAAQFPRWNRAGGRVMRGLTRRRNAEAALYRGAA